MNETQKIKIDVNKILRILDDRDISHKAFRIDAHISDSTWYRIKREEAASFHVAVTIAYMLRLDLSEIRVRGKDA